MTAEHYRANRYVSQNKTDDEPRGNFCSPNRVRTVEGTATPSNVKPVKGPVLDQTPQGSIHRSSVDTLQPLPEGHRFTSIHRPEPTDLSQLKAHQTDMLTSRAKRKRRSQ